MKKRNLTIRKSPAASGSTSRHSSRKDMQFVQLPVNSIAVTQTSDMRSSRTVWMVSTIHAKQTTRHTSEENMPSTRACGLYSTQNCGTSWKIICMLTSHHKPSQDDFKNGNRNFPTHPRTQFTATLRVRMDAGLSTIEASAGDIEASHGPSRGRTAPSLT